MAMDMESFTPAHPTAIDLFAGGGGLSEGLRMAGFNVVLACDADPLVQETHENNHKETRFLCERVERLNKVYIENALSSRMSSIKLNEIDLVAGGPPCQGFSTIGPRKPYDQRNELVLTFAQVVASLQPKAFIMENVAGILSPRTGKGQILTQAIETLSTGGFVVTEPVIVLNAADYGVPQSRRRAFVLGVRKDIALRLPSGNLHYPEKTHADKRSHVNSHELPRAGLPAHITLEEAISDLPAATRPPGEVQRYPSRRAISDFQKLMRRGAGALHNHHTKGAQTRRTARIKALKSGEDATSLQGELAVGGLAGKYRRLRYDQPCPTVTAHIGKDLSDFIHPKHDRWLSAREAARVQSFPDGYRFFGSQALQLRMIGNAVPPLLASWIAYEVGRQIGLDVHEPTM